MKLNFNRLEITILGVIFVLILIGIILSYINKSLFQTYTEEDGFIEWLTVIGLLFGAGLSFYRAAKLHKVRGFLFSLFTLSLGLLMIIAAGEEISWGQRIFGAESGDFFKEYNAQNETNFHNLKFKGIKINLIIFSIGLSCCLIVYMIILPYLYKKNSQVKSFLDQKGIILPKNYQTISLILILVITALVKPSDIQGKSAELLEFGVVFLFLLIVFYPLNDHIFHKDHLFKK
ncbi:MAG: hypothetical protein K2X86_14820 [Cytophagaceae bacterium]|nr:hypothetical protein [Cytophagaceae bacterium]